MPPLGASQATAEHPRPSSHVNKISEQDQAELDKLDRAVARMQKHTLSDPYIITIAQDRHLKYQYQWRSQQYQWLHGTPFKYDEGEGVQYQTYNFQEPGSSMLSLHAQHYPDERPGTADSTRNATGANTPAQGPKKVISFGAYKSKKTGETPVRDASSSRDTDTDKSGKQPAVKGPAERVKALEAESADMIKAVEENEKSEVGRDASNRKDAQRGQEARSEQPELKRKREEFMGNRRNKALEIDGKHSPPALKKLRTISSTSAHKETSRLRSPSPPRRTTSKQDAETDAYMPPKLSPLRYEPEALDIFELPPRLSPQLPANIDAALKATKTKHVSRPERDERADGRRPVGSKAPAISRNESPDCHDRARARSRSPEASVKVQSASADNNAEPSSTSAEKRRPSLIAKIKFKKARKEDVQRILKLPARPDKKLASSRSPPESSDDEEAAEHDAHRRETTLKAGDKTDEARRSGKGVAQKVAPLSKKAEDKRTTAEKRPRAASTTENLDDAEPPAKKKRVDDGVPEQPVKKKQTESASSQQPPSKKNAPAALDLKKAPSTPVPPPAPSPAVSTRQKSHMVTPVTRKDLLHPRREVSTDSQVETPPALSSTPSEQKRASQPNGTTSKPPSSNPPSTKAATSQAWETEQKRLERLGRDLKHGASDLLGNKPNFRARRIAAAKSLESLFCYLLAFTCSDRAALVANQNVPIRSWRSLTPFCLFVGRATHDFEALDGLASSLAVVIHAKILEIATQFPSEGPSRDSLLELSGALRKAALHADENMDVDTLMRTFPKTWTGRSKASVPAPSQSEFGEPRKLLQGAYRLPLGVQTDPLQAARAGVALLKEWIAKEGLDYDFKLGV
ncbi:hypothetical protein Q7P35_002014 [Cladosporium inversicolor]